MWLCCSAKHLLLVNNSHRYTLNVQTHTKFQELLPYYYAIVQEIGIDDNMAHSKFQTLVPYYCIVQGIALRIICLTVYVNKCGILWNFYNSIMERNPNFLS